MHYRIDAQSNEIICFRYYFASFHLNILLNCLRSILDEFRWESVQEFLLLTKKFLQLKQTPKYPLENEQVFTQKTNPKTNGG